MVAVRRMEPGDAERVAELTAELGYTRTAAEVREWIAGIDGLQAGLVACVDGEVVGWAEVSVQQRLQTDRYVLLGGLVVEDRWRGQGVGKRMCEAVEVWALAQGVRVVRLTSRNDREDAHRFYKREGYAPIKTSVVFEKRL